MRQSSSPPRIKGGLPWWLWLLLSVTTIAVLTGVIISSTPDDPQELYDEAISRLNSGDVKVPTENLAKLSQVDAFKWQAKYLEGMLAFRQVRDPLALKLLAEIPDGHELKPEALKKMGDAYRRTHQYKESLKAYEQAVALATDNSIDASVALSGMYIGIGANQLAQQVLDNALAKDPKNTVALQALAMSKAAELRYVDAVADFRQFLSTPGEFAAATPGMMSDYAQAILKANDKELIQQVVDEHLELFEAAHQKMELLIAVGRLDTAATMTSPDTPSPNTPGESQNQTPPVQKMLVLIEIERGEWKKAAILIRPLLTILPRDTQVFEMATRIYEALEDGPRLAIAQENLKQLQDLEAELLAGMKKAGNNIDDVDSRVVVAQTFMKLGVFDKAMLWHSIAATLDAQYTEEATKAALGTTYPGTPLVEFPDTPETSDASQQKSESSESSAPKEPVKTPEETASEQEAGNKSSEAAEGKPAETTEESAKKSE
jgi:tetratricopeptide (TPR) repeat protein